MPTISQFLGMTITMYFGDHLPAHFHVRYNEHEALIAIETLQLVRGKVPNRVLALAVEWADLHQDELRSNWNRCAARQPPAKIAPLED